MMGDEDDMEPNNMPSNPLDNNQCPPPASTPAPKMMDDGNSKMAKTDEALSLLGAGQPYRAMNN